MSVGSPGILTSTPTSYVTARGRTVIFSAPEGRTIQLDAVRIDANTVNAPISFSEQAFDSTDAIVDTGDCDQECDDDALITMSNNR